jgi:hypothetical protein
MVLTVIKHHDYFQQNKKLYLVALPITSPLAKSLMIQSRRVPILPSAWHHVSISTTSPLYIAEFPVRIRSCLKRKVVNNDNHDVATLPSRVLVDLNVHPICDPNESKFSHCCSRGKTIGGEPNTLCMVTPDLLHL